MKSEEYTLSINKISQLLDISQNTIGNWYKWYNKNKSEKIPELPSYYQKGVKGQRFWKESDIPKLIVFRDWVPKGRGGLMGDLNCKYYRRKKEKKCQENLQR